MHALTVSLWPIYELTCKPSGILFCSACSFLTYMTILVTICAIVHRFASSDHRWEPSATGIRSPQTLRHRRRIPAAIPVHTNGAPQTSGNLKSIEQEWPKDTAGPTRTNHPAPPPHVPIEVLRLRVSTNFGTLVEISMRMWGSGAISSSCLHPVFRRFYSVIIIGICFSV